MKISLTQENLAKALNGVTRIVGLRTSLPVLSNVLIQTDANRLKLSTTNLEIGINYWLGAKVETEGAITVPARLLGEYISNLPNETIHLETNKNVLHISSGHYESHLNGISAEEFPSIPSITKEPALSIDAKEFEEALNQVVIVASLDDARPVLNGVFIYTEAQDLVIAATDSYRLAERKLKLAKQPKQKISVIIPARTINELLKMLSEEDEAIDILLDENQVLFRFGSVEMVSRLIDGEFPDYRQLIPNDKQLEATLNTTEFTRVAKVASLFARESASSVMVESDIKTKQLHLKSVASQVGDNTATIEAKIQGEDADVSLNSKYILDALAVIKSAEVNFTITGKLNPCLIKPTEQTDYLHIIMPLRS